MATSTARASIRKPADADNVSALLDIRDNFDQIDEHLGYFVCTSGTRPTGVDRFTGRTIWETDTKNRYVWTGTEWYILNDIYRFKSAIESVSSTTMQDDNHISFDFEPGTWLVDAYLYASGHASNDIKVTWSYSGTLGNTGRGCIGPAGSGGDTKNTIVTLNGQSLGTDNAYALDTNAVAFIREHLLLDTTGAGTLKLRWARNTNTVPGTATDLTIDTHAVAKRVA